MESTKHPPSSSHCFSPCYEKALPEIVWDAVDWEHFGGYARWVPISELENPPFGHCEAFGALHLVEVIKAEYAVRAPMIYKSFIVHRRATGCCLSIQRKCYRAVFVIFSVNSFSITVDRVLRWLDGWYRFQMIFCLGILSYLFTTFTVIENKAECVNRTSVAGDGR